MPRLAGEVAELQEAVAGDGGSPEDVRSWYWEAHARMRACQGAATRALTLEEARSWGKLGASCARIREDCRLLASVLRIDLGSALITVEFEDAA